jgi:hypothetical protein
MARTWPWSAARHTGLSPFRSADADAALEIGCQAELRRGQPACGRPLVQGKGALVVLRHALAFGEAGGDLELRERIAVGSGLSQLRCAHGRVQRGSGTRRAGAVIAAGGRPAPRSEASRRRQHDRRGRGASALPVCSRSGAWSALAGSGV